MAEKLDNEWGELGKDYIPFGLLYFRNKGGQVIDQMWLVTDQGGEDSAFQAARVNFSDEKPYWCQPGTTFPNYIGQPIRIMSAEEVIEARRLGEIVIGWKVQPGEEEALLKRSQMSPKFVKK